MQIRDILDSRRIVLDLAGHSKKEILTVLATAVCDTHSGIPGDKLVDVLVKREETSTTAIADGIAIPHGKMELGNEEVICAFGRSTDGLDFQSVDGKPTQIFFLLVSPDSNPSLHLRWLAHLAVLLKNPELRGKLLEAAGADQILAAIQAEEEARAREATSADT